METLNAEAFMKVVATRRSIRSYKQDPVPQEAVLKVMEAGGWAPSSANSQPWDIVVVRDPATKDLIQESVKKVIARIKELRDFPFLRTFTAHYMLEAPVQLVVCADPRFQYVSMMHGVDPDVQSFATWGSVSMAVQNMLLAAHALGLASVVFTNFYPAEVKEILGVPDPLKVVCILPLGYAAEDRAAPLRRATGDFVHWEKFDKAKLRPDSFVEMAHQDPYGVQVRTKRES
jgi:5,6-dimethylbenzimidazole synthase